MAWCLSVSIATFIITTGRELIKQPHVHIEEWYFITDPSNGTTALHVAVTLNLDRVVGLLLENGASNSLQDKEVSIFNNFNYTCALRLLVDFAGTNN